MHAVTKAIIDAYKEPNKDRIFAVMGPNGAGKSILLINTSNELHKLNIPCFLLPPSRQFANFGFGSPFSGINKFSDFDDLWSQCIVALSTTRPSMPPLLTIENAIGTLLVRLLRSDEGEIEKYRNELFEYDQGRLSDKPELKPSLTRGAESKLGTILGYETHISQGGIPGNIVELTFSRAGSKFNITKLSDGEKQILFIGIFLMGHDQDRRFVFLVDEPELYLNEAKAVTYWEQLEQCFPSAIFVYATHNITFATRPSVDKTYLIEIGGTSELIDRNQPIPSTVMRNIVGARIQLLRTPSPIIFCEGDEHNLDALLITDLFSEKVLALPVGGADQVQTAVKGEPAWGLVRSRGSSYCGIIDRDTRSDEVCKHLEGHRVFCLPVYDIESILLSPDIAIWSLQKTSGRSIPINDYVSWLVDAARLMMKDMLVLVAKHLEEHNQAKIRFTFDPDAGATKILVDEPTNIKLEFQQRSEQLADAVNRKDSLKIIQLFRGKTLYEMFAQQSKKRFGVAQNPIALQKYRDLRSPEFLAVLNSIQWLKSFREKVEKALEEATA